MKTENPENDFTPVEHELRSLYPINIPRDTRKASQNRARYLAEVQQLSVSFPEKPRLTFQHRVQQLFDTRKVGLKMTPALISVIAAFVLFFGGGTISVAAAQNSLPNEFLFPLKLASEDFRAILADSDEERFDTELLLSKTRLEETVKLLENKTPPDDAQFARLETHLNTALNLAVASQTRNSGELQKLQNQLHEEVRLMEQIHSGEDALLTQAQNRVMTILETQNRQVNEWVNLSVPPASGDQNGSQDQAQDQTQDQIQDQTQDQARDQTQDQTRDQTQDQTRDQTQQQTQEQLNMQQKTPTPVATRDLNGNNNGNSSTGGSNYDYGSGTPGSTVGGSEGSGGNGSGGGGKSK